jgi:DNA repair protein RadC
MSDQSPIYQCQKYRLVLIGEGEPLPHLTDTFPLSNPERVAHYLRPVLETYDREAFVVLAMDARNHPIGYHIVSIGALAASMVHPRETFKFAILANAASVIFAHNHPSGDPDPSKDDIELTRRLQKGGEILGIEVLDSFVLAGMDKYSSLRESNLMTEKGDLLWAA